MSETSTATWLTQEAFDRLKEELTELSGPGRLDIAKRIEAAREEGDLKENGGYHAAKEEQGKMEARIRQLEELLRTATVGVRPPDDGIVELGMIVTAKVAGKERKFLLGSREAAAGPDFEVFSEQSPLGAAIVGTKAGQTVSYTAPNGKEIAVEILHATPFNG